MPVAGAGYHRRTFDNRIMGIVSAARLVDFKRNASYIRDEERNSRTCALESARHRPTITGVIAMKYKDICFGIVVACNVATLLCLWDAIRYIAGLPSIKAMVNGTGF